MALSTAATMTTVVHEMTLPLPPASPRHNHAAGAGPLLASMHTIGCECEPMTASTAAAVCLVRAIVTLSAPVTFIALHMRLTTTPRCWLLRAHTTCGTPAALDRCATAMGRIELYAAMMNSETIDELRRHLTSIDARFHDAPNAWHDVSAVGRISPETAALFIERFVLRLMPLLGVVGGVAAPVALSRAQRRSMPELQPPAAPPLSPRSAASLMPPPLDRAQRRSMPELRPPQPPSPRRTTPVVGGGIA